MQAVAAEPHADSPARQLLVKQGRLLDHQLASERMGILLKALVSLAGATAGIALALLVWQASRARGVVIEAFQTPPDLVAQGLSGQVVASQIEDRLRRMQQQTVSARTEASYSDSWSSRDISVEIPQTGVSIAELQRFLRQQFGHDARIAGEMFRAGAGLRISVRVSNQPGDTFEAAEADLDSLFQHAAEAAYRRTDPYRYASWLQSQQRLPEAVVVARELAASGPIEERAWALSMLARLEPDPGRAVALGRQAAQLDPDLAAAWDAIWWGYSRLGDYQGYFEAGNRYLALLSRRDHGGVDPKMAPSRYGVAASVAMVAGDFSRARREAATVRNSSAPEHVRTLARFNEAQAISYMHEPAAAIRLMGGTSDADTFRRQGPAEIFYAAVYTTEDYAAALREVDNLIAAMRSTPAAASWEGIIRNRLLPLKMLQLVNLGRLQEAEALAAEIPASCYYCMTSRGYLASARGEGAAADRWFEAVIQKSPDVAWAYRSLAETRLERDDLDGAIDAARKGLKVGPRWADLHFLLGEALLQKGDARAAEAKFSEAVRYAPRWGRLHLRWGDALAKLGKADEARAKWRAARKMDLAPSDDAALRSRGV